MATSPNYAWAEPDNSSLVKNGASDIRTLGDAIDTSVWNVGFGQAAKNKIINGDFSINQRNFTSVTTNYVYMFDRFASGVGGTDGTVTFTPQTFTAGTAPVAGYEGKNYLRIVSAGQTATDCVTSFSQYIEGVRTFAGQTITVSFWAKAATGTPSIGMLIRQGFGTGGSANVDTFATVIPITTSWVRYSKTITVPSIAGKTIGTANDSVRIALIASAGSAAFSGLSGVTIQNNTIDFWGIQAEYGSKATPFQLAGGGDPQSELAMCQRYYYRAVAVSAGNRFAVGLCDSTTLTETVMPFPVTMRTNPTALEQSGTASDYTIRSNGATTTASAVPALLNASVFAGTINVSVASGLTSGNAASIRAANTNAYFGWSAEL